MWILDRALDYGKRAFNYVFDDDDVNKSAARKIQKVGKPEAAQKPQEQPQAAPKVTYPNSVVNPEGKTVGTVGEVLIINGEPKKDAPLPQAVTKSAADIQKKIFATCNEHKINPKDILGGISRITGLESEEDINKLSPEQQTIVFGIIENSLSNAVKVKEKKNSDVNVVEAVLTDAILTYEIIVNKKTFKDLRELDGEVKTNADDFINNISKIGSIEEFEALKQEFEEKLKAKFNQQLAEIEKLPEDQREAAKAKLREKHAAMRQRLLSHYVFGHTSNKVSMNALSIASSRDLGKMTTQLYAIQSTDEGRKELAKIHSFNTDKGILKAYQARGEEFDKESYQSYVQTNVSWKDADSLDAYQTEVMYAAQHKDDPEYSFLTDEAIMAANKGIGVGAQINYIMTESEKEAFISRWTEDVKNYYGEDSVEYKALKGYVEQKVAEYNSIQNAQITTGSPRQTSDGSVPVSDVIVGSAVTSHEVPRSSQFIAVSQPEVAATSVNRAKLREGILNGTITEEQAQKVLGGSEVDLIEFYAKDPTLRALKREKIRTYVRTESDDYKLQVLAENVPCIIDLIMNNMLGDKQEFAQNLIKKNKVTHDIKVKLEKDTDNAVA